MNSLRKRWTDESLAILSEVFAPEGKHCRLRTFPRLDSAPFGTFEGRLDLRGYPLHRLASYQACDIDFSYARSPKNSAGRDMLTSVEACILDHCRFEEVALFRLCNGTFARCDFRRARFAGGALNGRFQDCTFDEANLSKACLGTHFERCSFRNTVFRRAELTMCRFVHCVFEDCDFADSTLGPELNSLPTETLDVLVPLSGRLRIEPSLR